MADWAGSPDFPGKKKVILPPTPADKTSKQMLTAHRVDDTIKALAHAQERMDAALKSSPTAKLRGYHAMHLANHLADALDQVHFLVDNLRRHYPAEYRELLALKKCIALSKSVSPATKPATFAHLTETTLHELSHAKRHADLMLRTEPRNVWDFNADHARKHLEGAREHAAKIAEHLLDNYPGEAKWLRYLQQLADPSGAHKYVKLAGSVPPSAFNVTVPGRRDQFGLRQKPSQALSPSPPLPSSVPLPTAKDCLAVVPLVPDGIDPTLSTTCRNALRQAAHKFEVNDVIMALQCLRQAQSALYSASRKDAGAGRPAVYGAAAVPPYEASSALAQMYKAYQDQAQAWRKVGTAVAVLIDRTRRHWFAGRINGYLPNLRM